MIEDGNAYRIISNFPKNLTPSSPGAPGRIAHFAFAGQIISIRNRVFFYDGYIALVICKGLVFLFRNLQFMG